MIRSLHSSCQYDSNIYLVDSDRTMLVDTGTGDDSPNTISQIRSALRGRPLDMVVLTHCHYDHCGGLSDIIKEFGCPVYAHALDAEALRSADDTYILSRMFGGSFDPVDAIDLHDGQVIDLGDRRFTVIHTPGHTRGSICLHDPDSGSLISGDTVFEMGVGRTDFPGGSLVSLCESIARLSNIDIKELYPGHGSMCSCSGFDPLARARTLVGV